MKSHEAINREPERERLPKLCPNCGELPVVTFTGGGEYMVAGCMKCGSKSTPVYVGDPEKEGYYVNVNRLYHKAARKVWGQFRL